jgi:uncharacterized damage-inducible protein DinB
MPGTVRPVVDERDGLLAYIAQQRDAIRYSVHGLTDEQAKSTPTASSLSLAGLIKHAARCERNWIVRILARRELQEDSQVKDWADEFRLTEGETVAGALEFYAAVAKQTESIVAEIDDLGQPVPVPRDEPWFPKDVENWSARWVLLHVIEETARHAGQADIIRESIDGKTMYELMASAEGWKDQYDSWQSYASNEPD